jgi:hypothetical protein
MSEDETEEPHYEEYEITKKGKRKTAISYRPRVSELRKVLRTQPELFYIDKAGRLYGIITDIDNPIYIDLESRGEIDNETSFLFFVWLPSMLKSKYHNQKMKDRIEDVNALTVDEVLDYPIEKNEIDVYAYNNPVKDRPINTLVVDYYAEELGRNSRTELFVGNMY